MNFLITSAWEEWKLFYNFFVEHNIQVDFVADEKNAIIEYPEKYDGLICNNIFSSIDINSFSNLKYIQVTSAGLDRVPRQVLENKKIVLNNAKGVYSIPIAEFVIGSLLLIYKQFESFETQKHKKEWKKNRNLKELCEKKVLIFGCGDIAIEISKRLRSFGCLVTGVDVNKNNISFFDSIYSLDEAKEVLKENDIVISCLPSLADTYHYFNAKLFALFKLNSIFVNISRGNVVDEEALICHLNNNIGFAILDVFENEPLGFNSPLWDMDNVLISPHNSFCGDNNKKRLSQRIIKNLTEWIGQ